MKRDRLTFNLNAGELRHARAHTQKKKVWGIGSSIHRTTASVMPRGWGEEGAKKCVSEIIQNFSCASFFLIVICFFHLVKRKNAEVGRIGTKLFCAGLIFSEQQEQKKNKNRFQCACRRWTSVVKKNISKQAINEANKRRKFTKRKRGSE